MCAILGFYTENPSEKHVKKLESLFDSMDVRGRDATGVAIFRPWEKKKRFLVSKKAIPVARYMKECFPKLRKEAARSPLVVGHIRAQTQGSPKDANNNHPVIGPSYFVTHNGTVATTPRVESYNYRGEVDTEIIVSLLESEGIEGLKKVQGTAAIAFVKFTAKTPVVNLWSHDQTFYVAHDESTGTYWWASTESALDKIAGFKNLIFPDLDIVKVPEDELFNICFSRSSKLQIKSLGELEGKKAVYDYSNRRDWDGYSGSYGSPYHQSYEAKSAVTSLPAHLVDGVEEDVVELYLWSNKDSKFILNEKYVEDKKIRPHLNQDDLDKLTYVSSGWPEEHLRFDQHNWRIVNKAAGLQMLAMARAMGEDQDV